MKKISIEKTDDIAEVIDRVLESPDTAIVLVVPRGSALGKSVRNFHLLKRELEATGRSLEIESVDDQILAFAKETKIPARHPLLSRAGGSVSDIVAVTHGEATETITVGVSAKKSAKKQAGRKRIAESDETPVKIEVRAEETTLESVHKGPTDEDEGVDGEENASKDGQNEKKHGESFFGGDRFFRPSAIPENDDEAAGEPRGSWWKAIFITVFFVVVAVLVVFAVDRVFGHAKIAIDFQKTPWQYQAAMTADKSVAAMNPAQKILPAEAFTASKNVTETFPATGHANVSQKAQGTLTIYNAYSSAPQTLVATTRFATPDGKIFRLASEVIVPGAKITNGQIVPSSVNAAIVADKSGPDYNVGSVAKLSVPGFENTPKYTGFYGVIASGTAGGFVGNKAVPTAADIANAKASTTAVLRAALANTTVLNIPSNFKILSGATNVAITKIVVSTTTDAGGNFAVFGQVSYQAIGFDESMVKYMLLQQAQATEASSTFSALSLTYSGVTPNFANGTVTFSVVAQGSLEPAFSSSTFASTVAGMSIGNARSAVAGLTNLSDGSISVWPVWLWNLPSDAAKISVTVN